ncbi:hypothetical protein K504DRAFT_487867 [Pleomassaria siparia CBS 279.74]|uniref:Uncharacterized protein n=1 Tax=Pleomassaria siparia CBS 279.74 TaxID=1314801 RepID=A0A6G1KKU7_9PLEO|nr:hypothetical protein K504DRAFT_487867 [Pleomassaria siparia CBS 279.74]
MFWRFWSCFGCQTSEKGEDSALRPRRAKIPKNKYSATGYAGKRPSVYTDEKATSRIDDLTDDFDDDAEEQTTIISEKQLEADDDTIAITQIDQEIANRQSLNRRSLGCWRKSKLDVPALSPKDTGDELHRRAEFEKMIKKMRDDDRDVAWAFERERREKWKLDHKNGKSQ